MATTREVRERAARLIEERGWARRVRDEYGGPEHCKLGIVYALHKADVELSGWGASYRRDSLANLAALDIERELGIRSLARWNSRPLRTKADVLAALRGPEVEA